MKTFHGASQDNGSFLSTAVEVNGLVYFSGLVHADKELRLHGTTIEEKFLFVMQQVEEKLAVAKLTLQDVVRVQIYMTDLKDLPALNKVYAGYFKHPMPVRTAVGVTALPLGASLEIEVIACRSDAK